MKWENTPAPFKPGKNWIDVGLFIGFEKAVDDELHNNFETKLLLEKGIGKFANKANIILISAASTMCRSSIGKAMCQSL